MVLNALCSKFFNVKTYEVSENLIGLAKHSI